MRTFEAVVGRVPSFCVSLRHPDVHSRSPSLSRSQDMLSRLGLRRRRRENGLAAQLQAAVDALRTATARNGVHDRAERHLRERLSESEKIIADLLEQQTSTKSTEHGVPNTECVVCLSEPVQTVLIPCGHLCMCQDCSLAMEKRCSEQHPMKCPLCRVTVKSRQRVYLPLTRPISPPHVTASVGTEPDGGRDVDNEAVTYDVNVQAASPSQSTDEVLHRQRTYRLLYHQRLARARQAMVAERRPDLLLSSSSSLVLAPSSERPERAGTPGSSTVPSLSSPAASSRMVMQVDSAPVRLAPAPAAPSPADPPSSTEEPSSLVDRDAAEALALRLQALYRVLDAQRALTKARDLRAFEQQMRIALSQAVAVGSSN